MRQSIENAILLPSEYDFAFTIAKLAIEKLKMQPGPESRELINGNLATL